VRYLRSKQEPDFNDSSASAWSKSSTGFAFPFPFFSDFDCFCRDRGVDGGSGVALTAAEAAADDFFFFFLFYLTFQSAPTICLKTRQWLEEIGIDRRKQSTPVVS
jgi:hypothetical protein